VKNPVAEAVDRGDLDELVRLVDGLCSAREWASVVDLRDRVAAVIAAHTAAISSSAWNVTTPKLLYIDSSWRMSEAGVIG